MQNTKKYAFWNLFYLSFFNTLIAILYIGIFPQLDLCLADVIHNFKYNYK